MRSVVLESFGPPEVLELRDLARPEIRHGKEVLVRIRAAGINPVDGKIRTGRSAYPVRLPAILGCDGSGVVEEIGTEVSRVRPGDEVYFCQCGIGVRGGTYAEHAVVEEALLARKPRTLDHVTAAAVPLALITAWESLYERARLGAGQQVLIHGGAGGVGHLAVQLAKDAGARVCTTVGSEAKASFVESLGADEPIFYRRENFSLAVLEWTDELGVDIALDTVGGETFELSFGAVRCYGDLVTLLQPSRDVNWTVARQRNLRVGFELMLTPLYLGMEEAKRHQGEILERGAELIDAGRLRVHVAETFPLERAREAHHQLDAGGLQGKLVLSLD